MEWPAKPPLTEGKVSTGVGVMVGRMCFARMCRCAAMADAPFHGRACALRRSPLSFAVQQSAVGAGDIEHSHLLSEKDSRKNRTPVLETDNARNVIQHYKIA